MLLLAFGAAFGTFMPWLETGVGTFRAFAGPGAEIFYLSFIGLGSGLIPVKWLAVVQAAIFGLGTIFLPLWQMYRMFSLVGFVGWFPGMGMIMIFGSGVIALAIARSFLVPEQLDR